ncbi:MAG: hypothetical protein ABSE70_06430 [Candidatus Limnocylindrales bacterium]
MLSILTAVTRWSSGPPAEAGGSFRPDEALARKMADLAETLAARALESSVELDFSNESIDAAATYAMNDLAPILGRVPIREAGALVGYLAERLGAYIGESTRRRSGGEWGWDGADGRGRRPAVRDGSGAVSHPVDEAQGRIDVRLDSLVLFHRMFRRH